MVVKKSRKNKSKSKNKSKNNNKNNNNKIKNCCLSNEKKDSKCVRKSDGKIFSLPRRFSKKKCLIKKNVKGFTMKSSCSPYNDCMK